MILLPDTAIQLLRAGGSLRLSTRGVLPDTMVEYAQAARSGGAKVTFAVDGLVLPDTMLRVARAGGACVEFDLVESQRAQQQ